MQSMNPLKRFEQTKARFWNKVEKTESCWQWIGGTKYYGYGYLWVDGKLVRAHRFSWKLHFGEIPVGLQVLHKCDNGGCVNSEHLFLGTADDNNKDAAQKNRTAKGERHFTKTRPDRIARGERAGAAKLTEQDIKTIRNEFSTGQISQGKLAKRYGVWQPTIGEIVRRKTWAHIT